MEAKERLARARKDAADAEKRAAKARARRADAARRHVAARTVAGCSGGRRLGCSGGRRLGCSGGRRLGCSGGRRLWCSVGVRRVRLGQSAGGATRRDFGDASRRARRASLSRRVGAPRSGTARGFTRVANRARRGGEEETTEETTDGGGPRGARRRRRRRRTGETSPPTPNDRRRRERRRRRKRTRARREDARVRAGGVNVGDCPAARAAYRIARARRRGRGILFHLRVAALPSSRSRVARRGTTSTGPHRPLRAPPRRYIARTSLPGWPSS